MFKMPYLIIGSAIFLANCTSSTQNVEITEIAVEDLPVEVSQLVSVARNGFEPEEVLKKVRDGRTYYDVEGELPDGSEIEFDVLMTESGPQIVEIQRDLAFENVPQAVGNLALETAKNAKPARIIESEQTDGTIIFEFFAAGMPENPAYEIKWDGDTASVLSERWAH